MPILDINIAIVDIFRTNILVRDVELSREKKLQSNQTQKNVCSGGDL